MVFEGSARVLKSEQIGFSAHRNEYRAANTLMGNWVEERASAGGPVEDGNRLGGERFYPHSTTRCTYGVDAQTATSGAAPAAASPGSDTATKYGALSAEMLFGHGVTAAEWRTRRLEAELESALQRSWRLQKQGHGQGREGSGSESESEPGSEQQSESSASDPVAAPPAFAGDATATSQVGFHGTVRNASWSGVVPVRGGALAERKAQQWTRELEPARIESTQRVVHSAAVFGGGEDEGGQHRCRGSGDRTGPDCWGDVMKSLGQRGIEHHLATTGLREPVAAERTPLAALDVQSLQKSWRKEMSAQ